MFKKGFIIGILVLCFCFFMSGVSAESFTYDEMASSAEDVARYTYDNSKIPKSVTINGKTVKDEDYLNMLTNTVVKISNGNKAGSSIPSRSAPTGPSGTSGGTLTKSQYITMAKNINSFYSSNKCAPNYATINGKNVRYESLVYGYSKVLYAYERDGTLPSEMSFPLVSGISSSGITVDTKAPSTSISLGGGWYNNIKTVTLTASDNKDSSPKVYYQLNGGSTLSATKTVSIKLNQGTHTLKYYAKDNKGNTETAKTVTYRIDTTIPTISISNDNNIIILTANDNMDNNPTIYYSINGGSYITSSKTATIRLNEGKYRIVYYAKDIAGNSGYITEFNATYDTTNPSVSLNFTGGSHSRVRNITLTANDNLDENPIIYYSINGGEWIGSVKSVSLVIDIFDDELRYYAVDNNGNKGQIQSDILIINWPEYNLNVSSNLTQDTYGESQIVKLSAVTNSPEGNPEFFYRINGGNWIRDVMVTFNLTDGHYIIEYLAYNAANNLIKGSFNYYITEFIPFNYTVTVPKAYNIDVINHKGKNYTSFVFPTRYVYITMNNQVFKFYWYYPKEPLYPGFYDNLEGYSLINTSSPGGVYFIPENGTPIWLNSLSELNNFNLTGIVINPNNWGIQFGQFLNNNIVITYHGYCEGDINQFSVIFDQYKEYNMSVPEVEGIYFNLNGENKAVIALYSGLPDYNDLKLRKSLAEDCGYSTSPDPMNTNFYNWESYNTVFDSNIGNILRFSSTGESVFINGNYGSIRLAPSMENITTIFQINNETITKTETISFGKGPNYDSSNGFEIVQSFAIVKNIVTDDVVQEWLNKSNLYPVGGMKAAYGTFLTALATIWVSDKLANANAPDYNVTWNRTKLTITMGGVNYMGRAYLHTPDANMGKNITSNNESNIIGFRLILSMSIQEIESYVLSLAGIGTNSSLSNIIGAIDNLNFTMVRDGELMIISTEDGSNSSMIINTTSGLVKNLVEDDDFVYKGVISDAIAYCFHDTLSDLLINGLTNAWNIFSSLPYISDFIDMAAGLLNFNITGNPSYIPNFIWAAGQVGIGIGGILKAGSVPFPLNLVFVLSGIGDLVIVVRNDFKPMDTWQYISYHPNSITSKIKTFAFKNNATNYINYIEVPILGNGSYDRDNAIYIDHNGARNMTKQETYNYF
ncbi:MAG: hypothetical protein ISP01_06750 [Methanobrevibacter arboriphilus]|uniref:Adhesin-like protein n=1 Tax=Methanobrevibacter arboriphilus TaxID=39441 RepID=A0A843ACG6_METAZ|nr:pseudomurein-binding repeat-containing protein [Methanobrevibacter arboriphilus]MBF4469087.1 hypothetical protein [Methanobrevibacter arboriphilus]